MTTSCSKLQAITCIILHISIFLTWFMTLLICANDDLWKVKEQDTFWGVLLSWAIGNAVFQIIFGYVVVFGLTETSSTPSDNFQIGWVSVPWLWTVLNIWAWIFMGFFFGFYPIYSIGSFAVIILSLWIFFYMLFLLLCFVAVIFFFVWPNHYDFNCSCLKRVNTDLV